MSNLYELEQTPFALEIISSANGVPGSCIDHQPEAGKPETGKKLYWLLKICREQSSRVAQ